MRKLIRWTQRFKSRDWLLACVVAMLVSIGLLFFAFSWLVWGTALAAGLVAAAVCHNHLRTQMQQMVLTERRNGWMHAIFQAHEPAILANPQGVIEKVNQAFVDLTGYLGRDIQGLTPEELSQTVWGLDHYPELWRNIRLSGALDREVVFRRKDGTARHLWLTVATAFDATDQMLGYTLLFKDVTERKATEQALLRVALHDELTALPNRRLFLDQLEQWIAHKQWGVAESALILISVHGIGEVNQQLGLHAGDQLIKQLATTFQSFVREHDVVARISGTEFAILVESVGSSLIAKATLERIGEQLIKEVAHVSSTQTATVGGSVHANAHIGMLLLSEINSSHQAMRLAYQALKHATCQGSDGLCVHET
jgi:diguanylate cyclase (GGDEF)-like protein/PAS domain S-box-containing protein